MGKLYDLIQAHMDNQQYGVSERAVASKIGVTQTTLANWREPKRLIAKEHLVSISRVTGVPYLRVLDALLDDIGYLTEESDGDGDAAPTSNVTDLSEPLSRVAGEELQRVAKRRPKKG